jgi:hypothetical protein
MPNAQVPLANITIGSSSNSVTFSSISGAYRDLVLICNYTNTVANSDYMGIRINGDTGSTYNALVINNVNGGNSISNSSYNSSSTGWVTVQGGFEGSLEANFLDYAQTNKHKNWLVRNNSPTYGSELLAGRWESTAAITTIRLYSINGWSFAAGSSFALYGVSA